MAERAAEDQIRDDCAVDVSSTAQSDFGAATVLDGADAAEDFAPDGPASATLQPGTLERADRRLDKLLYRINQLRMGVTAVPEIIERPSLESNAFCPVEPTSWEQTQVNESAVEALCLKYLLAYGSATGREVADQVKMPFKLIEGLMYQMKTDQMVYYRGTATMGDYQYQLTDMGRERARRFADHCTYFGSVPVSLADYIDSVGAQSLTNQHPTADDLQRAFQDLLLNKGILDRLGPAINSGRGLFLYGAAGNGKTSIAERVTNAFGSHIWIPRAIVVDGEIIRVFDPVTHHEVPPEQGEGLLNENKVDRRWVRIRRPTIVVGGELTMSALEVTTQ